METLTRREANALIAKFLVGAGGALAFGGCTGEETPIAPPTEPGLANLIENPSNYENQRVSFDAYPKLHGVTFSEESCKVIRVGADDYDSHKDKMSAEYVLRLKPDSTGGILGVIKKGTGCNDGTKWIVEDRDGELAVITGTVKKDKSGRYYVETEEMTFMDNGE